MDCNPHHYLTENGLLTCDFMSSMVAPSTRERIYGGTSEIMKTIIARDLTGLRA